MWEDCVLTKLVGIVDAASMTKDIQFAWKPLKVHQNHFFTQYGAGCVAVFLFVVAVGGWNVLCMKDYARGLIPPGLIRYFVRRLLPGIACAAIVAGICFALLPKLGNSDIQVYSLPRGIPTRNRRRLASNSLTRRSASAAGEYELNIMENALRSSEASRMLRV
jgi:hypothetical protein